MTNYTIKIPLSKTGKHAGKYSAIVGAVDEDLATLNWNINGNGRTKYAMQAGNILMHRVVLARMLERELLPGENVDHIDGNGLNNQRDNLRVATHAQNQANARKRRDNTSGFKGVSWCKKAGKWRALIRVNEKRKSLGFFDTPEEAYAAYCAAADELFGEFSNHG